MKTRKGNGEGKNDKEDNNDKHGDMYGFNNSFDEGVGVVQHQWEDPSGGDNEDESDDRKMKGSDSNKKGKRNENQEESDSNLDEE